MNDLVPAGTTPLLGPIILRQTRRRLAAGLLIMALAFGGGGAWTGLAPLNSAAVAPGVVGADGRNKVVQHLEGGIIRKIAVKEGDHVGLNQTLFTLDTTRAQAQVDQLQGELDSLRAMAARLTAERDGQDDVGFPGDMRARLATDPEVGRIIAGQQSLFRARRDALANERNVLGSRISQYEQEIAGLDAQRKAAEGQIDLLEEEIKVVRMLVNVGQERKPRLLALERDEEKLQGDRGNAIALMARARQNIGETQLRISQLDVERLNQVVNDLRDTEAKIFDTSEKLRAAQDVLDRTVVTAPIDGTVVKMNVHTIGGVIQAGENLLEIVPADDRLLINARLKPTDIAAVRAGQTAEVRLDAYSQRRMPMVLGKVVDVSADALHDDHAPNSAPYYQVRVAVDKDSLAKLPNVRLYPGMPAEVMVVTGERTMLDYLAMPIASSLRHALNEE
jgi:HlyD family type I secretion membrane fusion protein